MATFVDTHCHLDAPEFGAEMPVLRARASARGVAMCVIPAVAAFNFAAVRELAHAQGDAYALGIHPLCTGEAKDEDLETLDAEQLKDIMEGREPRPPKPAAVTTSSPPKDNPPSPAATAAPAQGT